MNRALLIIGVPAVGVVAFYAAAFWGFWEAAAVAIALAVLLLGLAILDRRRRSGGAATGTAPHR